MQQVLLTPRQIAAQLGISPATFYLWHALGRIGPESISPSRKQRYLAEEVDAWIAAGMPDRKVWVRTRPRQYRR